MPEPLVVKGTGYIDMVDLVESPGSRSLMVHVRRTYDQVAAQLTRQVEKTQHLPGWQAFARARQGGE